MSNLIDMISHETLFYHMEKFERLELSNEINRELRRIRKENGGLIV